MNRFCSSLRSHTLAVFTGLLMVGAAGCVKEDKQPTHNYVIEGTVYFDCSKKPYAGQPLELVHSTSAASHSVAIGFHTVTDQFGRFKFTYSEARDGSYFTNEYQVFATNYLGERKLLISRIPGATNWQVGELFVDNKVQLFVDISVGVKKASVTDTLYFGIGESSYHYMTPVSNVYGVYEFDAPARLFSEQLVSSTANFYAAIGLDAYRRNFAPSIDNPQATQGTHLTQTSEFRLINDCTLQRQFLDTVAIRL